VKCKILLEKRLKILHGILKYSRKLDHHMGCIKQNTITLDLSQKVMLFKKSSANSIFNYDLQKYFTRNKYI